MRVLLIFALVVGAGSLRHPSQKLQQPCKAWTKLYSTTGGASSSPSKSNEVPVVVPIMTNAFQPAHMEISKESILNLQYAPAQIKQEFDITNMLSVVTQKYKESSSFLVPIILLILQNSGLILFMRYSIVKSKSRSQMYIISTAVLSSELIKFFMSSLLSLLNDVDGSIAKFVDLLYLECVTKKDEFMRIIVPSILYAIQNNLQYVAVANLSAPVFQTMYQMKIVTTALFSVLLLKRNLLAHQWASILTLFMGASAVQLSQGAQGGGANNAIGLVTVVVSCFTSGFSGVYFEKTLKNKKATASIWLRNVQMSFFGILIGVLGCLTNDRAKIMSQGFFHGYSSVVWTVILLQALGGLVVSMVVKHADNLMKGFATSLSIIISAGLSALLFNDLRINRVFLLGSSAVVASTIAFGYTPALKKSLLDQQTTTS